MDNQLALMKKLQKDPDTIAYAHNEEIVLIKRVVDDDSVHLTEVTLNPENGSKISERIVSDSEMKLTDFDTMKEFLTEETRNDFNADWNVTKLNVDIDKLENTDLLSVQSVEDDYIELLDAEVEDYRTLENAMKVLDSCLTKIQKKRYILSRAKGLSTREIAEKEGVSQRTVQDSLELAERKIKIFQENPEKYLSKPSKKLYK
ncbi:MAG: sigma factor-like helix-turn-helix DNA-binding protein [Eubacteriales bacterium]